MPVTMGIVTHRFASLREKPGNSPTTVPPARAAPRDAASLTPRRPPPRSTAPARALAALAVIRARMRRWPAWLALGFSALLLIGGAWFDLVIARVPDMPTPLRVGAPPPDFTLPDATNRPVTLADYRGKKPVVLVFY